MEIFLLIGIAVLAVLMVITIVMLSSVKNSSKDDKKLEAMNTQVNTLDAKIDAVSAQVGGLLQQINDIVGKNQKSISELQDKRLSEMSEKISGMSLENEQKLQNIRTTMDTHLTNLQKENSKQLEQMRATVDEKLQETLESRITKSFELVNRRLEEVYKGLGEMQTLATGVGDLKKVLSNVKTRGILGEIQLGAILNEILAPEQYDENVETVPNSGKRVEYAIKLPGDGDATVYFPIDSKFPMDAYMHLVDAEDTGDPEQINLAKKNLVNAIDAFAKDISTKYIQAPYTTDFAMMFLPTEGLYAEVANMGMIEKLQSKYKISIAGPTTTAALLNSLQMGFKTLAIQKRSGEVWETLAAVRTEFEKFGNILNKTQKNISQANKNLDALIGTRTRQIIRKLKDVETIDAVKSEELLEMESTDEDIFTGDDE